MHSKKVDLKWTKVQCSKPKLSGELVLHVNGPRRDKTCLRGF